MPAAEWYKVLGILSVLLTWSSIMYILLRIPRNIARSISHHAAQRKESYRIFALGMTGALVCMTVFVLKWLTPALQLPGYLVALFLFAIALEMVTTWVPLTQGRRFAIHQWCSYGTAVIIPVILILLAWSPKISTAALWVDVLAIAFIVTFWFMFFFVKKSRALYLVYQSLYIAAFHLALLSIVFAQ